MFNLRFLVVLFVISFFGFQADAQCPDDSLNMTRLFHYDDPNQPTASGVSYNDVWGYVDPLGNEYGIIGAADSILIFDVTDPSNIYKAATSAGDVACVWRDMKTYDHYLYAGSECGEGLLVFDLSYLPDSFPRVNQVTTEFTTSHNIYIEVDSARLYSVGTNGGVGEGMVIYDLSVNPEVPVLLKKIKLDTLPGEIPALNYYIHDIFVKGDTAYCSHGRTGYAIWDVSDVNNINRISNFLQLESADLSSYVHSSWNTSDNSYAYVATEVYNNTQIYIVDQSDPTAITLDTTWREPLLECLGQMNNVPHNPYVIGNLLYISYYQDGVNILDISDPRKPVRVGFYDLDTTNVIYNGTTSNWGVYPFLPSGIIIASDTKNGFSAIEYSPPTVPLELIKFEAKPDNKSKSVLVSWEIANATNVFAFEIQRSIDGTRFEKIAEVPFDYYFQKYEYFDNGLKPGKYFYRLKIKDFDGSFTFSDMNAVNIGEITSISIFPSASDGFFNVQLSKADDWNVQTYTLDGKLVFSSAFFGNETTLDLSFLPASMYVLKIYSKTSTSYNSIQILR